MEMFGRDESSDDADAPEKGEDGEVIPGEDDSDDYERLCNILPPPGEQVRTDHSDAGWNNICSECMQKTMDFASRIRIFPASI